MAGGKRNQVRDKFPEPISCEEILGHIPNGFKLIFLDCSHYDQLVMYENIKTRNRFTLARSQDRSIYLDKVAEYG